MVSVVRAAQFIFGLLLWALLAAGQVNAQALPAVDINLQDATRLVGIAEFSVSDAAVSLEEARRLGFQTLWPTDISRGLTNKVHWLRFSVVNSASQSMGWVFHGDSNYLDNMQVYFRDRGDTGVARAVPEFGSRLLTDQQPFSSRMLDYRKLAFEHDTPAGAVTDVYVALSYEQADAMRLEFSIYERRYFDDRSRAEYLLFGAWYGVLSVLLLGSLMLALIMRQPSAAYYAAFVGSTMLMWGLLNGVGFQYLWSDNVYLQNQGFHLAYLLFAFCAFQFSRHFLRLSDVMPRINRAMWYAQALMVAAAALRLLGSHDIVLMLSYLALASTLSLPIVGLRAWQRGVRHARWFCVAWLMYSLTLTLAVLNAATSFPGWSMDAVLAMVQVSTSVEVLLLMVAIGERVMQIDKERREALNLAHRDPLTGLGNRRLLVETYQRLVRRFEQTGVPVFLGLIDLDEFKSVNDRYGHDAGDVVLCRLADILQQHSRGDDTCIRYGGDEFVLLLQADNVETVEQIVERIRIRFSERPTLFGGQMIRHTLSAGVITAIDQNVRLSPAEILMKVDLALYEAKDAGRNRTIVRA
ncbi:hypothetical protein PHACT_15475 [Pseudohongiella acticola]|jgi:diguanylate cyclase (GGDEF)-like protein|uniref:diguanylate cyclase n=1 Tax=Pseudohongiella acticola TaxID=1524254 RepID=A0A1E8CFV2_9GAMM|nr:diguanylate cyclase [Pseudohongiella acticola]OFE11235.1 hypothetical protein PHACT_15475 [Pseudohongiella acticola]